MKLLQRVSRNHEKLDTNVLVRYLAADGPRQLAAAEGVIEECRENDEPLFLLPA